MLADLYTERLIWSCRTEVSIYFFYDCALQHLDPLAIQTFSNFCHFFLLYMFKTFLVK